MRHKRPFFFDKFQEALGAAIFSFARISQYYTIEQPRALAGGDRDRQRSDRQSHPHGLPQAEAPHDLHAVPDHSGDLAEREPFGHEKGAFAGASERKRSRFGRADGACHFPHLTEIQEVESASKPPLPKAIYTIFQSLLLVGYRKKEPPMTL